MEAGKKGFPQVFLYTGRHFSIQNAHLELEAHEDLQKVPVFMNTNDPCIKKWFGGVNAFLDAASEPERSSFLAHCAKACSDSYPLALYRTAFSEDRSVSEAMEYLKESFPGFAYTVFPDRIEIEYPECGCDLFKEGLITSPRLCECSEASLRYIWQEINGPGTISVVARKSRIRGDECCLFEIRVAPLGHSITIQER